MFGPPSSWSSSRDQEGIVLRASIGRSLSSCTSVLRCSRRNLNFPRQRPAGKRPRLIRISLSSRLAARAADRGTRSYSEENHDTHWVKAPRRCPAVWQSRSAHRGASFATTELFKAGNHAVCDRRARDQHRNVRQMAEWQPIQSPSWPGEEPFADGSSGACVGSVDGGDGARRL